MDKFTLAFLSLLGVNGRKFLFHTAHTLTGKWPVMPLAYPDSFLMAADFPAPTAALREVLPSPTLQPLEIKPGTGVVRLVAAEFRRVELFGPYNELQVNIPVTYRARPNASGLDGHFVVQLPITSDEACRAGRDILGLPKFMASVRFEEAQGCRRCRVSIDGQDLITLEVAPLPVQPSTGNWYFYGVSGGHLLRTPFDLSGQGGVAEGHSGASFVLGEHPLANEIACLAMERTPVRCEYAPHISGILRPPEQPLAL